MNWIYIKPALRMTSLLLILAVAVGFGLLFFQHGKLFSVQSGSMAPVLQKGDLVVVKRVPASDLAVGDVITFINPANKQQTVTHRIIELPSAVNQNKFVTKGDANALSDVGVLENQILGSVKKSVPYAGTAVDVVRQPIGLILLIYIPALAVVISEIKRLSEYYRTSAPYFASNNIRLRKLRRSKKQKAGLALKTLGLFVTIACLVYVPVQASLMTNATLSGNTISAVVPQPSLSGILIRQLTLRCSADNSTLANKRPDIIIYNPTKQNVDISGWKIKDNSGVIVTLPSGQILKKKHTLRVTPLLADGLLYAGDSLSLATSTNQSVDGLSWGSDVSQLNPSVETPEEGTRIKRKKAKVDTNTSADWKSNDHRCPNRDDEDDDHNDCSEPDRTTVINMYHLEDQESSDDDD